MTPESNIAYTIFEHFSAAKMSGEPVILIEGIHDIAKYNAILKNCGRAFRITPIQFVEGYSGGCEQIIKAIRELKLPTAEGTISEDILTKWILGIIDSDNRAFSNRVPEDSQILLLRYYSIESHYITKAFISTALKTFSLQPESEISDQIIDFLWERFTSDIDMPLLCALESLKKSINASYDASFKYSDQIGKIKNATITAQLNDKRVDLHRFASQLNLNLTFCTLLKIAPGKWILKLFCEFLASSFDILSEKCRSNQIKRCQPCIHGTEDQCLYRCKDGTDHGAIYASTTKDTSTMDVVYIVNRALQMYT